MKSVTRKLAIFVTFLMLMEFASAQTLYRYKDEHGKTVLGNSVPPSIVPKGYDILNAQGRVVRTVPPALTPEQIAARDAEKARQEALEAERAKQREQDFALRQLYSHPNDAVRVLSRKIQDIETVIGLKQGQIEGDKKQILEQESKAANMQREGRTIPENLLKKIRKLKEEVSHSEGEIVELKKDMTEITSEFDYKIRRLEIVTGKEASDYPALLEKLNGPAPSPKP